MDKRLGRLPFRIGHRLKSLTAFYFLLVICLSIAAGLVLSTSRTGVENYTKITTRSVRISEILLEIRQEADDIQSAAVRMVFNREEEDVAGEADKIIEIETQFYPTWTELRSWLGSANRLNLYDSLTKYRSRYDAVRKELLGQSSGQDNARAIDFYYSNQIAAYDNYQLCIQHVSNGINQAIKAELAGANTKTNEGSSIITGWLLLGFLAMVGGGIFVAREHNKLVDTQKELAWERQQKMVEITRQTLQAQEQERDEVGKELHDNVNQLLGLATLNLSVIQAYPEKLDEVLPKSITFIQHAIAEIRTLSQSLVNPLTKNLSLSESVEELVSSVRSVSEQLSIRAVVDNTIDFKLNNQLKLTVYRIIQEQLNNILKHAQASLVVITLEHSPDTLKLHIEDNGVGFDPHGLKTGIGLANIRNRAAAYHGCATFTSAPGMGCTLDVTFPLETKGTSLSIFRQAAASFF